MASKVSEHFIVAIKARPGASKTKIIKQEPQGLVIDLAAPPEDGKANAELLRFLAKNLGIGTHELKITRGSSGRHKSVSLPMEAKEAWLKILEPYFT